MGCFPKGFLLCRNNGMRATLERSGRDIVSSHEQHTDTSVMQSRVDPPTNKQITNLY